MKVDEASLLHLEERLARGEVPEESAPELLDAVRHVLGCRYGRGAARGSSERRGVRSGRKGGKKGHGRHGAADYPGAEHVVVSHRDLKAGDPCPESGCTGKLYDTHAPSRDIELRAGPPITGTVSECQVLRCASCQKTFTAPLAPGASGVKYHPSVDATLAVMRYGLGMPHNRLAQWQKWAGIPLPASTQFERVKAMAEAGRPVVEHLETIAANRPLLQSDDTGARILALLEENKARGPDERTGIFTTGIMARGLDSTVPPIVLYSSGRRHAGENVDRLLSQRAEEAGDVIHLADASSMAPTSSRRIKANCMAHARRRFIEVQAAFPEHCAHVLDAIATIYHNDDATSGVDPEGRLAYHQEHSAPVMAVLQEWMQEQLDKRLVEPNSRLGKAFSYVRNHWDGLTRFLKVPGVPLDNNQTERELRPVQRHRKNSLFFKNESGAGVGDVLLTLTRTAVINRIDPVRYLTALATHASQARAAPQAWLPWTYQESIEPFN